MVDTLSAFAKCYRKCASCSNKLEYKPWDSMRYAAHDMLVICLEGCHGCGKTSIIEGLSKLGVFTLDECFMDLPATALHPQSLTCEVSWLSGWFQRILATNNKYPTTSLVVCDRSPLSAVFYAKNGHLLENIIDAQIKELAEVGIVIRTVYLRVEEETLWQRITQRVAQNPERKRYNEHKRVWMDETVGWYENRAWDYMTDNTPPFVNNGITPLYKLDNTLDIELDRYVYCCETG